MSFPTAEKWKPWADFKLYSLVKNSKGGSGNVANVIPVVHIVGYKEGKKIKKLESFNNVKLSGSPEAGRTVLKLLTDDTPELSFWNSYLEKVPFNFAPAWRTSNDSSIAMFPHIDNSTMRSILSNIDL